MKIDSFEELAWEEIARTAVEGADHARDKFREQIKDSAVSAGYWLGQMLAYEAICQLWNTLEDKMPRD